jgi:hypothetical protein
MRTMYSDDRFIQSPASRTLELAVQVGRNNRLKLLRDNLRSSLMAGKLAASCLQTGILVLKATFEEVSM